jgi:hypothetical protein
MSNERQHTYHRASQYASHAARALGGARTQRHPTRQKLRCTATPCFSPLDHSRRMG